LESLPSVEAIGVSVEDATGRGLEALNATRDQVRIDVIEKGDGSKVMARVRVTLLAQPEKPRAVAPADAPAEVDADEQLAAEEVLTQLLQSLQISARIETSVSTAVDEEDESEGPAFILNIVGADLGILIGRRGETLNDLQFITRLITSKRIGHRTNLIVDVEGYKMRREQTLRRLAARMAAQVVSTRKPIALEPMPANERRIIHIALRNHPQVRTESVGQGDSRKVTLIPRRG
jgi:spoIIIJ-associated protein